jgi:acetyl/propionyl-CoA carboxylase alpha subunit
LPDIGRLQRYVTPKGLGVRVDDAYEEGQEIPIFYDPMIAKLITFGKNREEAIVKMCRAIDEYDITGIKTTLSFGKFVMQHEAFKSGNFDTHFVNKYFAAETTDEIDSQQALIAALLAFDVLENTQQKLDTALAVDTSNWIKNRKN